MTITAMTATNAELDRMPVSGAAAMRLLEFGKDAFPKLTTSTAYMRPVHGDVVRLAQRPTLRSIRRGELPVPIITLRPHVEMGSSPVGRKAGFASDYTLAETYMAATRFWPSQGHVMLEVAAAAVVRYGNVVVAVLDELALDRVDENGQYIYRAGYIAHQPTLHSTPVHARVVDDVVGVPSDVDATSLADLPDGAAALVGILGCRVPGQTGAWITRAVDDRDV